MVMLIAFAPRGRLRRSWTIRSKPLGVKQWPGGPSSQLGGRARDCDWTVGSSNGKVPAVTAASTTEQGRATKQRIVAAAAELIGERGVAGTSLDDIRAATSSSKSQLYHYFGDKHGLVEAVIDHQSAVVLG